MKSRAAWIAGAAIAAAAATGLYLKMHVAAPPAAPISVTQGEVRRIVSGPGTVQSRVPVTVSARISARIVSVHADQGDLVREGQVLAVLDDRDLAAKVAVAAAARTTLARNIEAAAAAQAKALADLELARNKAGRDAQLHRSGFISASSFEASALGLAAAQAAADSATATLAAKRAEPAALEAEARYAAAQLSHARLLAPMDALVIERSLEPGATAMAGMAVFRLVDPHALWISARIDEALIGALKEGQPARIRLRSGDEHAGRVARISRQSDAATRELEVNVAFDAPPERFAIDQEAEVRIDAGVVRGPAVPVAALVRRAGEQGVYVVRNGRRTFQPLRIAASDGKVAVIAEGIQTGATLAAWTSR